MHNVNLNVCYGEVYGLLGANGAGKTTTIKMLCGLLEPTSGTLRLAGAERRGHPLGSRASADRLHVAESFRSTTISAIEENLDFFAGVYGVPPDESAEKKRWVLSFSGLTGKEQQITGSLPGGWKQRVAFGAAIMHEPRVLFLDEPTSGVDPLARRAFWRMINRLADMGTAILVTTHYLEEAEQCNRLGFMVAGELVAEGSAQRDQSPQGGHLLEFLVDQPQRAADMLKSERNAGACRCSATACTSLRTTTLEADGQATVERLREPACACVGMREERFSLEDVFIAWWRRARASGQDRPRRLTGRHDK